ncbi:MAG: adenylate/guanylate cyclase domain-containing protein [Pseudohongiellaceae bacterium]
MMTSLYRQVSSGKRLPIMLGILATFAVLWVEVGSIPGVTLLIQRLEYLVYDQRLRVMPRPDVPASNRIVIVDLDERSLQAEGQFPWNRIKVGRLVEKLRDNGVLVVGFDITFPEPDRNIRDLLSPINLAELGSDFNTTLETIEPLIDADRYFADVMQTNIDVILAINFNLQNDVAYNNLPESLVDIDPALATRLPLHKMSGFTGNIDVLQLAARGSGSMNQLPDPDGIVRRVPLVLRYQDRLFPALALEMVRVFTFEEGYELIIEDFGGVDRITGISIGRSAGEFKIPTNQQAEVLVPYVGGSSLGRDSFYPYVSATDVLNDNVDPTILENALVLVGTSAPGLQDMRSMPLDQVYPGVEVHANMLNALLKSVPGAIVEAGSSASTASVFSVFESPTDLHFPYRPQIMPAAMLAAIIGLGTLLSFAFPYFGPALLTVATVGSVTGVVWANFMLWDIYKMDVPMVMIVLLILLLASINMIYGFLSESLTRKTIKGMFDQYVPPAYIDSMLKNPDAYSFEGESREMSVLFSDIRGFTSISEALSATQLKTLLNDFFTPITEIIFDCHGTIDKYVGDMVMAFWGAPLEDKNHRQHAVLAALRMQLKVAELKDDFVSRGFPEVHIGIGINTGMMNVGDMGSTYRRSYTVLGDSVNLSSRLEGLTKFYGVKILVGEQTCKNLDGFLLRLVDRVKVKGKDKAIDCYEPLCQLADATDALENEVQEYHAALDLYHQQQWNNAEAGFRTLHAKHPDCLLYEIYLARIVDLRDTPLAEDWDGSFTHTSK